MPPAVAHPVRKPCPLAALRGLAGRGHFEEMGLLLHRHTPCSAIRMTRSRSSFKSTAARARLMFVLGVVAALPACGRDGGGGGTCLTCFEFKTEPCLNATDWVVSGFGDNVDAPPGKPPAFLLVTGLRQELFVSPHAIALYDHCDEAVGSVRWITSRPETADFEAGRAPSYQWLVGRVPGETQVSAEVTLRNGAVFPAPMGSTFFHGTISIVRVVPCAWPTAKPHGLAEGDHRLEAELGNPLIPKPSARLYQGFDVPTAGRIDMVVSWRAAADSVISHLCQGDAAFPGGCVPIIDGNRSTGTIPQVGSAQTTPGRHTLWITNGGPDAEQVEYEIGLIGE